MDKESLALLKEKSIALWLDNEIIQNILNRHTIEKEFISQNYAMVLFEYFTNNDSTGQLLKESPKVEEFLVYLKEHEFGADELFDICYTLEHSILTLSYDLELNSRTFFENISAAFDSNFRLILKFYTDTIFQKLIDAKQEALRSAKAKEYFLSNMSHEIRTPLNAILGFVNLLNEEKLTKKQRNYLEIILSSGENLLSIINDILDFSKLRSGEFSIEPKVFSLHDELSHTVELFVASARAKDITLLSYIDPKIPSELYGDSLRIKQIISNFLSNAIKFTPQGGLIEVEASYKKGILKVAVSDNGVGIDVFDLKKVFTAFAQAQYAKESNIQGTGLGLSISYQLAELMNGKVKVASVLGSGSTFWMEIPIEVAKDEINYIENLEEYQKLSMILYTPNSELNEKEDSFLKYAKDFEMNISVVNSLESDFDICIFVDDSIKKAVKKKILSSEKKFVALMSNECDTYDKYKNIKAACFPLYCKKLQNLFYELLHPDAVKEESQEKEQKYFEGHILVAEDNEANQELIKIILNKYGLSFDLAQNGLEAYELYKKNSYDLILMDEQMPVMDGSEAVQKIIEYEAEKGLEHTPVSALTANVIKGAKERGMLVGFDAFLGKPVVLKELERIFDAYLKEGNRSEIKKSESRKGKNKKGEIEGLDVSRLTKELMLTKDELTFLLDLFLKKMKKSLPELKESIDARDFQQIALRAHSIKGSSGNFRIEDLLKYSQEMEEMARAQNESYDYEATFKKIEHKIDSISINK